MKFKFIACTVLALCAMNIGAMQKMDKKAKGSVFIWDNSAFAEDAAFTGKICLGLYCLKQVLNTHRQEYNLPGDPAKDDKKKKMVSKNFYLYEVEKKNESEYKVKKVGSKKANPNIPVTEYLFVSWYKGKKGECYKTCEPTSLKKLDLSKQPLTF